MPKADPKLEKLACTIQKYLDGNPVLLIGSGGSIPYGLPSMTDLSENLIKQLNSEFASDDAWKIFLQELENTNNFEIALDKANFNEELHQKVITNIWNLINSKDRQVIAELIRANNPPPLALILRKFAEISGPTQIITTNYDRLIEYAIDSAQGICDTGFKGECIKSFNQFHESTSKRLVNLYKVHGSINWFKHKLNNTLIATDFIFDETLSDLYFPMIVTPGNIKYKETHNDPFRTVMAEADKALRRSPSYLCIGYGFNDEHIQPVIIDENRTRNKPVVIITRSITQKIQELFIDYDNSKYLIISDNSGNGSRVYYSALDYENFDVDFWKLQEFYNIWFE
jgi:hypothetical protein